MRVARCISASLALAALALVPAARAGQAEAPPAKPEFETGRLIPKVVTVHDEEQSYALYLPKAYTPEKKWPILYGFSPGARGTDPVQLFKAAAEKYGWIVVGSNNSRNGPHEPIQAAIEAMLKDTAARLSLDERRRYATGFSGGARVAFHAATSADPPFAGVIPMGAGLATGMKPIEKGSRMAVFALCGWQCFNHGELLRLEGQLAALGLRQRLEPFPGGHSWAPAEKCGEALRYMELLWRLDQGQAAEPAVLKMLELETQAAEKLLASEGLFMRGHARFKELAGPFKDSPEGAKLAARAAEIEATERYKQELAAFEELKALHAELAKIADAAERTDKSVAAYVQFVAGHAGTEAAARLRVMLESSAMAMANGAVQLMQAKRYEQAEPLLRRVKAIAPRQPALTYNLACVLALNGKKDEALKMLAESVELGFRDAEHIRKDPDLESLRETPEYAKIMESLAPKPEDQAPAAEPAPEPVVPAPAGAPG